MKQGFIVSLLFLPLASCGIPRQQSLFSSNNAHTPVAKYLLSRPDLLAHGKDYPHSLDVEGVEQGQNVVYVPQAEQEDFQKAFPGATLQQEDIVEETKTLLGDELAVQYSYRAMEARLKNLAIEHPAEASLEVYGTSTASRNLYALRVKKTGVALEDPRPVIITGATHGNEILTTEVVMELAEDLLRSHKEGNVRYKNILQKHELYFIPMVSPDSFETRNRYVDGVDPNRNYPWPEQPERQSTRVIKALMDFAAAKKPVGTIDYHSAAGMIMYPWAYTYSPPAPEAKKSFERVGKLMARSNNYQVGQISSIMYVAKGSSADYFHWKWGSLSYGVELSNGFVSRPRTQEPGHGMFLENRESTWVFVENLGM